MMKAVATAVETADRAAGQSPVQPLDQRQGFQIQRLHGAALARRTLNSLHGRCNGFHHDTSPVVGFIDFFDETFVPPDKPSLRGPI